MIFLRKKMEMFTEKIEAAALNKTNLIEIFSVGKKIHDVIRQCRRQCRSQLSTKHTKSFLLYDQINKKFGDEIY